MKTQTSFSLLIALCCGSACSSPDGSSDSSDSTNSGGDGSVSPTGGRSGGGEPGSGGAASSGGAMGSGGAASSGGANATGGMSAMGGTLSTGGAVSTGGTAGAGGSEDSSGGSESGVGGGGGEDEPRPSAGCGSDSTLENTPGSMLNYNELSSGGATRRYVLRLPPDYDNTHPYRIILGFHGATGNAGEVAGGGSPYFGLYDRAEGSTIFVAMEAVGGIWSSDSDAVYVDDVLEELKADLCIDETRVLLEGFSQGGAMSYTLVCARPGVFRAAVAHSPGGLTMPMSCDPVAYFTSLGQQENDRGQTMTADFFAAASGCTAETHPEAPSGGHLCSDYSGCSEGHPVRWCSYDGGHTPSPTDSGQQSSWMPDEVWGFLSEF